ncbi:MAG: DUF3843 family protein [Bacteroidales bacterium]
MKKAIVTYKDWMEMHPWHTKADDTVLYYVKLANRLTDVILKKKYPSQFAVDSGCALAAYLQDVVSGSPLFGTMRSIYINKYSDRLPMLEDESVRYYNDEVNYSDISFLLWHFSSQYNKDVFVSPSMIKEQKDLLTELTNILEEAYEDAPESEELNSFLQMDTIESPTFNDIVTRMVYLNKQCYLNAAGANYELKQYADGMRADEEKLDEATYFFFLQEYANLMLFNQPLSFCDLYTNEFFAEIIGKEHKAYNEVLSVKRDKLTTFYAFILENEQYVVLEHPESGVQINVEKDSLPEKYFTDKPYWLCELVQHGENYRCVSDINYPPQHLEEESERQKEIVKHLFDSKEQRNDYLKKMTDAFDKMYNGKPFIIVSDIEKAHEKIEEFFCQNKLDNKLITDSTDDESGNILIFMNPDEGLEIYPTHLIFGKAVVKGAGESLPYPYFTEMLTDNVFSSKFIVQLLKQGWIRWSNPADENILKFNIDFLLDYYKCEPSLI